MKTIIIYAGKTGTTEKCAKLLENKLKKVKVVNLKKENVDIAEYDLIIIGSNIRFGKTDKLVKKFLNDNIDLLKTKKVAYYICCGFPNNANEHFETNFTKSLLEDAICYDTFGGELDVAKLKGLDKFIVSIIKKTDDGKKEVKILEDNIDKFVDKLKA